LTHWSGGDAWLHRLGRLWATQAGEQGAELLREPHRDGVIATEDGVHEDCSKACCSR